MADTPHGDNNRAEAKLLDVRVLRTVLGVLGILLPIILYFGARFVFHEGLQKSLSSYYHTGMRDWLVGILWVIGILLFAYEGYSRWDNIAGHIACGSAVGVAIFPTAPDGGSPEMSGSISTLHFICAAALFATLIYFSGYSFTKMRPDKVTTHEKRCRNIIYIACAWIMALCMVGIIIYKVLLNDPDSPLAGIKPVYWLESFAVVAFGFSWFTKGETLVFKDK